MPNRILAGTRLCTSDFTSFILMRHSELVYAFVLRFHNLHQVKCGVRGDTGPACNVVGMIDRKILGIQHLYKRPVYERTKVCICTTN